MIPTSSGSTFSLPFHLLIVYYRNPRCPSRPELKLWYWSFLTSSLNVQAVSLYSSLVAHPSFYLLHTSFSCLSSVRSSLFICAGLLLWLKHSASWNRLPWCFRRSFWISSNSPWPLCPSEQYSTGSCQAES